MTTLSGINMNQLLQSIDEGNKGPEAQAAAQDKGLSPLGRELNVTIEEVRGNPQAIQLAQEVIAQYADIQVAARDLRYLTFYRTEVATALPVIQNVGSYLERLSLILRPLEQAAHEAKIDFPQIPALSKESTLTIERLFLLQKRIVDTRDIEDHKQCKQLTQKRDKILKKCSPHELQAIALQLAKSLNYEEDFWISLLDVATDERVAYQALRAMSTKYDDYPIYTYKNILASNSSLQLRRIMVVLIQQFTHVKKRNHMIACLLSETSANQLKLIEHPFVIEDALPLVKLLKTDGEEIPQIEININFVYSIEHILRSTPQEDLKNQVMKLLSVIKKLPFDGYIEKALIVMIQYHPTLEFADILLAFLKPHYTKGEKPEGRGAAFVAIYKHLGANNSDIGLTILDYETYDADTYSKPLSIPLLVLPIAEDEPTVIKALNIVCKLDLREGRRPPKWAFEREYGEATFYFANYLRVAKVYFHKVGFDKALALTWKLNSGDAQCLCVQSNYLLSVLEFFQSNSEILSVLEAATRLSVTSLLAIIEQVLDRPFHDVAIVYKILEILNQNPNKKYEWYIEKLRFNCECHLCIFEERVPHLIAKLKEIDTASISVGHENETLIMRQSQFIKYILIKYAKCPIVKMVEKNTMIQAFKTIAPQLLPVSEIVEGYLVMVMNRQEFFALAKQIHAEHERIGPGAIWKWNPKRYQENVEALQSDDELLTST